MPKEFGRNRRVAQVIKEELAVLIQKKFPISENAVLKAKKFITESHFLMLFPDDLIMKKNCSKDMITIHKKFKCSVMAIFIRIQCL